MNNTINLESHGKEERIVKTTQPSVDSRLKGKYGLNGMVREAAMMVGTTHSMLE